MLDRSISTKFLTLRVSLQNSYPNFQNICLTKNGGHFEFSNFLQKLHTQKCLYLEKCARAISTKFLTHRVSLQSRYASFKKFLSRQKWQQFPIFDFFAKIAKHKNAYISKTVLDRAISTKFLNHRVSLQSSHANFQKNFVSPKWRPF